jgi:hypothetical protein
MASAQGRICDRLVQHESEKDYHNKHEEPLAKEEKQNRVRVAVNASEVPS